MSQTKWYYGWVDLSDLIRSDVFIKSMGTREQSTSINAMLKSVRGSDSWTVLVDHDGLFVALTGNSFWMAFRRKEETK